MMKRILLPLILMGLVSCSLPTRSPVTPTSWLVAPERTGEPLKPRSDLWLKVGTVSVAPPFDGKSLVYRISDQRYEKDFYNVYTTIPAEMIADSERQWLNKANIFSATVGQSNSFFPYYTVQATVNEFYGDYRVRPEAVVSMEFFLTAQSGGSPKPMIGANRYTKRIPLKDNSPEALVLGQQQALAEIFTLYEEQLSKYAANLPKPLGQ